MSLQKSSRSDAIIEGPYRVPVNVICGSLGVGKTTAINHLLSQRPEHERWAVLVNEYGQIGLDQALLAGSTEDDRVEVREVAGGCICCSAGLMFRVSLVLLLRTRPDRLLIEPTGLATLSGILDTLLYPGIREAVDLRSVITLVAPGAWPAEGPRDEVRESMEGADILLANRCDQATEDRLQFFEQLARSSFPAKRWFGRIVHGQLPLEMLDRVTSRPKGEVEARVADADPAAFGHLRRDQLEEHSAEPAVGPDVPHIRRCHLSSIASTVGWVLRDDDVFLHERTLAFFRDLMTQGAQRLKAVLHTESGWRSYNLTEGTERIASSPYRRDSRLEMVFREGVELDPDRLEAALWACLVQGDKATGEASRSLSSLGNSE